MPPRARRARSRHDEAQRGCNLCWLASGVTYHPSAICSRSPMPMPVSVARLSKAGVGGTLKET